MVGGALIVFHMGKFAYAVADDSGIYVQRWRTQRFVAWHDVRSIEFSLIREELVLRLRRPVGGYLEVIIPAGVTTPAGVSVGEYWAMLRGRSEPEPVAWVRARIERAKTENTGQYNVDPPTG